MSKMNELVQAQAVDILKQISTAIQTTGDIAQKELPDIAQQYIIYGRLSGIFAVTICVAFIIALVVAFYYICKYIDNNKNDTGADILIPVLLVLFVFSCLATYAKIENLILNIFAPKVWIILEIKNLFS